MEMDRPGPQSRPTAHMAGVVAGVAIVQTAKHASSRSRKIRTCDSGTYAIPGLPRASGLLQVRPLQAQRNHGCRPPAR